MNEYNSNCLYKKEQDEKGVSIHKILEQFKKMQKLHIRKKYTGIQSCP